MAAYFWWTWYKLKITYIFSSDKRAELIADIPKHYFYGGGI